MVEVVREKNFIFGLMFVMKVEEFVRKFDKIDFKIFNGWLENFKFF